MKNAYLIIAHDDKDMLIDLLKALDCIDNDLFVHIDRKSDVIQENELHGIVKQSKLNVYKKIDVRWGNESQVQCEMFLITQALNQGYHDYYHIISGADYPIKGLEEIKGFLECNSGKEFIHFDSLKADNATLKRVLFYHPLNQYYKETKFRFFHKSVFLVDDLCVNIQSLFKIKKECPYKIIQKGCNWCSFTHSLAKFIISQREKINKLVKGSRCADEIFIQTVVVNSDFVSNLYLPEFKNDYRSCIRYIQWDDRNKKSPKILTLKDYDKLMQSEALFGRKFNSKKSRELLEKLKYPS